MRQPLSKKEISDLPDFTEEAEIIEDGPKGKAHEALRSELWQRDIERLRAGTTALGETLDRKRNEVKVAPDSATRERLTFEAFDLMDKLIRDNQARFNDFDEQWFAQGEAVRKVGDEEMRLVEIRENLGVDSDELAKIEKVFSEASTREVKDLSREIVQALPEADIKRLPEFKETETIAKELVEMEEHLEAVADIDFSRGKINLLTRAKNAAVISVQRAINPNFRRYYADYEEKSRQFEEKIKKLESVGFFAGKSRLGRAMDARMRGALDNILGRVKGVRGR